MFTVLIPARYASTRLPGKPLADIGGKPMVVRVAERAQRERRGAGRRRDRRRADHVPRSTRTASTCLMTRADHPTGTDRLAEAAAQLGLDDERSSSTCRATSRCSTPALIRAVADTLDRALRRVDRDRMPPDRRCRRGVQSERGQGRARPRRLRAVLQPRDDSLGARRVRRRSRERCRPGCRSTGTTASMRIASRFCARYPIARAGADRALRGARAAARAVARLPHRRRA